MSTTIIPGVSKEIDLDYLHSFNDQRLKYKFTVSVCYGPPVKQFKNCTQAAQYIYEEPIVNPDSAFKTYIISLNKTDGSFITLKNEDISALCAFEDDDELFEMFEIFAEKMARPGRVEARKFQEAESDDEEKHFTLTRNPRRPKTFSLPDERTEVQKEYDDYSEEMYQKALSELDVLRLTLRGLNDLVDERNIAISYLQQSLWEAEEQRQNEIVDRRNDAMRQIMIMTPSDFQSSLLYSRDSKWQLPKFERAQPGEQDYPDLSKPERQRAHPHSKLPFTPQEFDRGIFNAGDVNRSKLRYMTEEEYIAKYYDLQPREIDPALINPVKFDEQEDLYFH